MNDEPYCYYLFLATSNSNPQNKDCQQQNLLRQLRQNQQPSQHLSTGVVQPTMHVVVALTMRSPILNTAGTVTLHLLLVVPFGMMTEQICKIS
jgi:hypothetical protein